MRTKEKIQQNVTLTSSEQALEMILEESQIPAMILPSVAACWDMYSQLNY